MLVVLGTLVVAKNNVLWGAETVSYLTIGAWEIQPHGGIHAGVVYRPPNVPVNSNICCSFGVLVSPHLLSSCLHMGGFYLSKDSGCMSGIWRYTEWINWFSGPRSQSLRTTKWTNEKQLWLKGDWCVLGLTKSLRKNVFCYECLWEMFVHPYLLNFIYNIYSLHNLPRPAELQ